MIWVDIFFNPQTCSDVYGEDVMRCTRRQYASLRRKEHFVFISASDVRQPQTMLSSTLELHKLESFAMISLCIDFLSCGYRTWRP